jgi:hypothetical protein
MSRYIPLFLLGVVWISFIVVAPRLMSEVWLANLTILGMIASFAYLSRHGLVRRPDPLSLSGTARRPYWETREEG